MKRIWKQIISLIMVFAILGGLVPFGGMKEAEAAGPEKIFFSPAYEEGPYYKKLKDYTLTGTIEDIAEIAYTQVNYHAGQKEGAWSGAFCSNPKDYTEYGYWYSNRGKSNGDWCAKFVSWCARAAGISTEYLQNFNNCAIKNIKGKGIEIYSWKDYLDGKVDPRKGDLLIYSDQSSHNTPASNKESFTKNGGHVEVVYDVISFNKETRAIKFETIGGNTSWGCKTHKNKISCTVTHRKGSSCITGSKSESTAYTGKYIYAIVRINAHTCAYDQNGDCSCGNHNHAYDNKGNCTCGHHNCLYGYNNIGICQGCESAETADFMLNTADPAGKSVWDENSMAIKGSATPAGSNKFNLKTRPYENSENVQGYWDKFLHGVKTATVLEKGRNHFAIRNNDEKQEWYLLETVVDGKSISGYVHANNLNLSEEPIITFDEESIGKPKDNAVAGSASAVSVKGKITSTMDIKRVKAGIYEISGEPVKKGSYSFSGEKSDYAPGIRTTYLESYKDIFDNKISFRHLDGGRSYIYRIEVTSGEAGKEITENWEHYFYVATSAKKTFNVSFVGGSGGPDTVTQGQGATLDLGTLPQPELEGFDFIGWAYDDEAEEPDYEPNDKITVNSDMTLYAVWFETEPPAAPTMTATTQHIGVGRNATVSWNKVDRADYYTVSAYDAERMLVQEIDVKETTANISFDTAGTYQIYVSASSKKLLGADSETYATVVVHEPSRVTYYDHDGSVWAQQFPVAYGEDAFVPYNPSRAGYRFVGWEGDAQNVTEDRELTAKYSPIGYTVTFYDANGDVAKTDTVYYNGDEPASATPPDEDKLHIPENYAFIGWDTNAWQSVTEDGIKVYPSYIWENPDVPIKIEIDSVEEAGESVTDGYWVNYTITNNAAAAKTGRVVIVLKSSFGKFLTQTESGAFYLAGGEGTTYRGNLYVPFASSLSDEIFATVEAYVVGSYTSLKPIAEPATFHMLSDDGDWSAWMTQEEFDAFNGAYVGEPITKNQYRIKTKQTYETTLESYLDWAREETGEYEYGEWGAWSSWQDALIDDTDTDDVNKVEVRTQTVVDVPAHTEYKYHRYKSTDSKKTTQEGYDVWFHFHQGTAKTRLGGTWESEWSDQTTTRYSKTRDYYWVAQSDDSEHTGTKRTGGWYWKEYKYNGEKWFYEKAIAVPATYKTQYSFRTRTADPIYSYYTWSAWSEWADGSASDTATQIAENRTMYRVKLATEGEAEYTFSGNVGAEAAGKQAIFTVYKVDEASDYSNEYMKQVKLGENGSYSFAFNTLEKPTVKTGDFTAVLTIEGSDTPLYIGTIEAPKPEYTVTFVNEITGEQIGAVQTVLHGGSVTAPAVGKDWQIPDGYTFIGWEYGLTNIRDNMVIHARFKANEYTVMLVDWANCGVSVISGVEHGSSLADARYEELFVEPTAPEGYSFLGWKAADDMDLSCVTDNMVVTAAYDRIAYTVTFYGADGSVLSEQSVAHGDYAEDPAAISEEGVAAPSGMYFGGWDAEAYQPIKQTMAFAPQFFFEEDVASVVPSIEPGIYEGTQLLTLSCEDADVDISYYMYDAAGDPLGEEESYDGETPIEIAQSMSLTILASVENKNAYSQTMEYTILSEGMRPAAPAAISAVADAESVTVSWDAVDDATGYILYKSNRFGEAERIMLTDTSYTETGLRARESYTYHVGTYRIYSDNGAQYLLECAGELPQTAVVFYGDQPLVQKISIDAPESMLLGDSVQLDAIVAPANAYDQRVVWSVENGTGRASVSGNGVLTAESAGTVLVTATANDGSGAVGSAEVEITSPSTETVPLTITSATLVPGGTAKVSIEIGANSGAELMQFAVVYDADRLKLVSCEAGEALNGFTSPIINGNNEGVIYFAWEDVSALNAGGSLLDLVFTTKGEPENAAVLISIPREMSDYTFILMNGDFEDIAVSLKNGMVSVLDLPFGDVNMDGNINVMDVNIVRRYTAKLYTLEGTAYTIADVDGNGTVNILDANLIRRYVVKLIDTFPIMKAS